MSPKLDNKGFTLKLEWSYFLEDDFALQETFNMECTGVTKRDLSQRRHQHIDPSHLS
jgi:hypothetical protein